MSAVAPKLALRRALSIDEQITERHGGVTMKIALATLTYFVTVFGIGFLLGPIRVLWLEPRVGPVIAVACEAPFLLVAMVLAARGVPRWLGVRRDHSSLLLIGLGALALQQIADFAVGLWLRGIGASQQLTQFTTPQGLIYAALLVAFATMPALMNSGPFRKD